MNTALEPPVHAQPDHALQPVPVALDQDGQSGLVAVAGGVQEILVGSSVGAQGGLPIPLHGNAGCTFTALERIVSRPPRPGGGPVPGIGLACAIESMMPSAPLTVPRMPLMTYVPVSPLENLASIFVTEGSALSEAFSSYRLPSTSNFGRLYVPDAVAAPVKVSLSAESTAFGFCSCSLGNVTDDWPEVERFTSAI